MRSYNEYQKELVEEKKKIMLNSDELDDVAGKKPLPMTEEEVIDILKGHRFKFSLDNYQ